MDKFVSRAELDTVLARGEDSRHQFKRDFTNADALAAELAALANGGGGQILIGVTDGGQFAGGVAEALFGIPESMARAAWIKLPEDIQAVLTDLYNTAEHRSKHPEPPLITISKGSILDQPDCDGLVNSANENLRAGSGVCGAIHAAAGPDLEAHSHKRAPLPVGAAISTPGFRLPQRMIIHTRGPKFLFDPEPASLLAMAMTNTLRVADQEKLTRIAVPAISMGGYAYPHHEAVPILVDAARSMLPHLHYVREIRFVVVKDSLYDIFRNHIGEAQ